MRDWLLHNPLPPTRRVDGIALQHWTEGGTAITNCSSRFAIYEEAIRRYGDPRLVMIDKPTDVACGFKEWKSLHYKYLDGRPPDLSEFWQLFRDVEREFSDSASVTQEKP